MTTHVRSVLLFVAMLLAVHGVATAAHADAGPVPEEFTAVAVNGPPNAATTSVVEIRITRWSTDAEKERFARDLVIDGPDAFLAELSDARPVGEIQSPPSLPWPLRFAREEATPDGGRRILIITDRPIGAWEMMADSASLDYPFSLIELRLNADGEGEGLIAVATKITVDGVNQIALENYDTVLVRLIDVRSRRST